MEKELELQLKRLAMSDIYSYEQIIYLVSNLLSKLDGVDDLYRLIGALNLGKDKK